MEARGQQQAGEAARIAVSPDLAARLRTGAWIVVAWGIAFLLTDAWVWPAAFTTIVAIEATQMAVLLAAIGWLQADRPFPAVRAVGLALISTVYVLTAATASLRGDLVSSCFEFVACAIATGGFLPWGPGTQLASLAVATAALGGNALAVPPPDLHAAAYPSLGILAAFAGSVWVAYEGARERHARRHAASLLAGQSQVLELMARGVALPTVLDTLCTAVEAQGRGMLCSILRLDGHTLHDAAAPSLPAQFRRAIDGLRIGPDVGCCGSAAFLRRTVVVADMRTDPRWMPFRELAIAHDLRACWSAPILAADSECLGTFAMYYREHRTPSVAEERLLDTAAQLAGIALSRARDEAVLARSSTQVAEESQVAGALLRVAEGLLSALDTPRVLRELCRLARALVGCEGAATVLRDPEGGPAVITADTAHGPWPFDGLRLPDAAVVMLLTRLEGGSLASLELDPGDPASAQLWHLVGVRRALVAPLRRSSGTEVAGLLLVADRTTAVPFTSLQQRVAAGVAKLGSLALENAHLVEQLRMATAAKSEFVSTISHELRTPISVIIGYADMLGDDAVPDPERQAIVRRVRRTSHELLELIQATLDLSRLESGRDGTRLERVAVHELLSEMATDFAAMQREGGASLRWEPGPPLECTSDPRKLRIIVKNLVVNALKFTPDGSVTVRYRTAPGRWELEVEDMGVGIPPDQLGVIFEMFRQGDGSDRRSFGGVGLGLYLVRRLATQLGGTVRVTSTPERGSTFTVTLPLGTAPALGTGRATAARREPAGARPPAPAHPASTGALAARLHDMSPSVRGGAAGRREASGTPHAARDAVPAAPEAGAPHPAPPPSRREP